jgi:hypothetical protein
MKWILLTLELLTLFFTNNVLFMIPGRYDWSNFVAAGVAVLLAATSAWFSGKIFSSHRLTERIEWQEIVKTPPALVWIAVVSAFCVALLMKTLG